MLYIVWNNGIPQAGMGYWLKSFNADPAPVPGRSFSVPQINNCEFRSSLMLSSFEFLTNHEVPLPTTGIFIVMALIWGWLSDGPCRGARWPFIYAGAVITVSQFALLV
jgi:ACS family pantothenate transporter-like MFS transporter